MSPKPQHYDFANQLLASKDFFDRSTRVLDEADSGFRPKEGMMTVAQQVAHAAQTLDWFIQGASRPEGFARRSIRPTPMPSSFSARAARRIWRNRYRPAR